MAAAFDKSLGQTSFNAASASMALTTSAAAVAGSRVYVFLMWVGAPTLSSVTGGGLTWTIDATGTSQTFWIAIASADAPAGLASGTVITGTFSASATHGLISAASFTGVPNASPHAVESLGNPSGIATAAWGIQLPGDNDYGSLLVAASCSDTNATSTPTGDATEIHDFADASFFGSMTTQYQLLPPNTLGRAAGTWSTVSGSVSNNTAGVVRRDNSTPVAPPVGIPTSAHMRKVR